MLNAAIKDCPVFGGKLKSFDAAAIARRPGVKKVVAVGDSVASGQALVSVESMKMEHSITAPWPARVVEVKAQKGQRVEEGTDLIRLEPAE
jgi:biotin carboxyl carrier protein